MAFPRSPRGKKNDIGLAYRLLLAGWTSESLAAAGPSTPVLIGKRALTVAEAQTVLRLQVSDLLWALDLRTKHETYGPPWGPIGWGYWPSRYLELIQLLDDIEAAARKEVNGAN